ncbi:restriction endonuclease subunit S [Corallibacter sp.]|uniref:restriction endonuclease subunit S n=1 Tax=Corallibacter sp. TaxID=2038084 RepID=UPI003AB41953
MVETETKIQRYESYKNFGVEWLGDIPEHWETLANKYIFQLKKNQVGKKAEDFDLLSLTLKGVVIRNLEDGGKFPADFDTYQEVKKGDFVFCLFDVEETPRCVGLSNYEGMITGAYTVMEVSENFDRNFLYYFYLNLDADKRLKPLYTGLRNTISKDNFFAFKTFIPPLPEQTAIAQFLDDKTTKIDQAIAIKQQQIALLKERKQILIHKAVTRGLDDTVILKDSGVEWIGEIPAHWEVKPLRHIGKTQNGLSKGGEYFGTGFPFLTYSDVYNNRELPYNLSGLAETSYEERKQFSVKSGDVFFTRTSETVDDIGFSSTCFESVENGTFAGFLIRFRPNKNVLDMGFSKFYFSSSTHRPFFVGQMNLVIRASLSQDHLKQMPILLPPLSEQKEIAYYIETASAKIETAISLKEKEINKLQEYKSSLINSVVTGKVRVF